MQAHTPESLPSSKPTIPPENGFVARPFPPQISQGALWDLSMVSDWTLGLLGLLGKANEISRVLDQQ